MVASPETLTAFYPLLSNCRVLKRRCTRSATDSGIRKVRRRREDCRVGFSKIRTSNSRSKMRRTVSSLKFHCSASSAGEKCCSNRCEHGASPGCRSTPSFVVVPSAQTCTRQHPWKIDHKDVTLYLNFTSPFSISCLCSKNRPGTLILRLWHL